jgi:hypothetical protein
MMTGHELLFIGCFILGWITAEIGRAIFRAYRLDKDEYGKRKNDDR